MKKRFLEASGGEAIIVRNEASIWRFRKAAGALGLPYAPVHGPLDMSDITCDANHWMIFGEKNGETLKKKKEIEDGYAQAKDAKEEAKKKALENTRGRIRAVHNNMVRFSSENDGAWDMVKTWKISCPSYQSIYCNGATQPLLFQIFTSPRDSNEKDIWGKFNFLSYGGVFRFLRPGASTPAGKGKKAEEEQACIGDKRKRDIYDDDEKYCEASWETEKDD